MTPTHIRIDGLELDLTAPAPLEAQGIDLSPSNPDLSPESFRAAGWQDAEALFNATYQRLGGTTA